MFGEGVVSADAMTPANYIDAIRDALAAQRNPAKAAPMRAYLHDQFEFLGLAAPERRALVKALPEPAWISARELLQVAQALWAFPEREYRYSAIDLLRRRSRFLSMKDLAAIQRLLRREPWWETVDGMAAVVGAVVHDAVRTEVAALASAAASKRAATINRDAQRSMDAWLAHKDIWVRRVAMLHQLGWRNDTDADRLFHYALTLAPETDFFIRKATGWALRDYARWQPKAVKSFVRQHGDVLSPLTVREALKHLS